MSVQMDELGIDRRYRFDNTISLPASSVAAQIPTRFVRDEK
jgi:hypothetical protein